MTNGFIIIDKPTGTTSNDAVMRAKRLLRPKKIGHTGTLDPMASGVLVLALGEATKAIPYMTDTDKAYVFNIKFGASTSTDDAAGEITGRSDKIPALSEIESALCRFIGNITQVPPKFSAILINGRRAYDLAREGGEFEMKGRAQSVRSLKILRQIQPDEVQLEVEADRGFYVRSLARDIAAACGSLGHASLIRRIRAGAFSIGDAIPLDNLTESAHNGAADVRNIIVDITRGLDGIPVLEIDDTELRQGRAVESSALPGLYQIRSNNRFSLIARAEGGLLKPERVFNP
ncbi:MAG: tRNA pseudouridine(55) synthase TruB [Rickettsiales bacterium]|nr:tRNA pseudouridine(55) synthase TruB [Rickettsiales bacterium]